MTMDKAPSKATRIIRRLATFKFFNTSLPLS